MVYVAIPIEKAHLIVPAMRRGIASALNKTMKKAQTDANKKVREVYNVRVRDLKSKVRFEKATPSKSVAGFTVTGQRFTLMRFAGVPNKRGVPVKIRKDRGRKTVEKAFLALGRGNRLQVFRRVKEGGKYVSRYPIEVLTTVGPVAMFDKEAEPAVEKSIKKNLNPLINHEVEFKLSKIK